MKSQFNEKDRLANNRSDMLSWLAVTFLLVLSVAANYYYRELAWSLRAAVGLVLTCILLAIVAKTVKGRQAWDFAYKARQELRKVVWPSQKETLQITSMIVAVVLVMVFILWGVDGALMRAVSWLTGG